MLTSALSGLDAFVSLLDRNVTQYLSLAKKINVRSFSLPPDVLGEIEKLNVNLNTAAETLEEKTTDNAAKIKRVFYVVRSALITVAIVMLILSFLGLLSKSYQSTCL